MNLDSLLIGENAAYIDELYIQWQENPSAVSEDWKELFESWDREEEPCESPNFAKKSVFSGGSIDESQVGDIADRQARVAQLINAYRVRGHTNSTIDPLGRRLVEEHPDQVIVFVDDDLSEHMSVGAAISGCDSAKRVLRIILSA